MNKIKLILYFAFYLGCIDVRSDAIAYPEQTNTVEEQSNNHEESLQEYEQQIKYHDPFEPFNRVVFGFNQMLDFAILRPVCSMYDLILFDQAKISVANFLDNLSSPLTAINDVLCAEPVGLFKTLSRFVINSTLGILGLFDPASNVFHITKHKKGFGDTLRKWGLSPGPYLVLPLIGSSSFLDSIGMLADHLSDPYNRYMWNTNNRGYVTTRSIANAIITRHRFKDIIDETNQNRDPYNAYRLLYMQNKQIVVEPDETIIPDDII